MKLKKTPVLQTVEEREEELETTTFKDDYSFREQYEENEEEVQDEIGQNTQLKSKREQQEMLKE